LVLFKKRDDPKRRKLNALGLWISSGYLLLTLVLKGITFLSFENALQEQHIAYTEIETKPAPLNTVLWLANIDTKDAFLIGDYSLLDTQSITFGKHPKNHHLLGDLANHDKVKRLVKLTNGWYTVTQKDEKLYFNDLRFGLLSTDVSKQSYVFSFLLEGEGENLVITENQKRPEDAKKLLSDLWQRIKGN
jgi:inner membrane protein